MIAQRGLAEGVQVHTQRWHQASAARPDKQTPALRQAPRQRADGA